MKKLAIVALYTSAFLGVFAAAARAAVTTEAKEAVVLSVKGDARVTVPGSAPKALAVGDKVAKGSQIVTGAGSEVNITPIDGTISTIRENTSVTIETLELTKDNGKLTKQKAVLDLSLGEVVSTIDPSKKSVNDYGVRTPKGVAAARGTQYSTKVSIEGGAPVTRITVSSGSVSVARADGSSVSVANGNAVVLKADGTSVNIDLSSSTPPAGMTAEEFKAAKDEVVATLEAAVVVLNNIVTLTNSDGTPALSSQATTTLVNETKSTVEAAIQQVLNPTATPTPPSAPTTPVVDPTVIIVSPGS